MNKKISLGLAISIAALAAAVTFIITMFFSLQSFNEKVQAVNEKAAKYERLEELDSMVRERYFKEFDEAEVMNGLLKGYVAGLGDPYSSYMTPEEYQKLHMTEMGKMVGIGITATMDESGYIRIIEAQKGSPAQAAGLRTDDLIVAVAGQDVLELGFTEAIDQVRGEEGTKAVITVRRDGKDKEYSIVRESFEVETVSSKLINEEIGYISVTNFRDNTAEQFKEAMDGLLANGADALIFDMRDNGGGLLSALEEMVDPILPEGVIATATYRDGSTQTILNSDAEEMDIPMVVLVNGNSASAAELFAVSLRDFDKAEIVGTQTYGKGIMQMTSALNDGSGLTLTVAAFQTVRSECYHGVGITPDVVVEAGENTVVSKADPQNDPQLAKAIEILKN